MNTFSRDPKKAGVKTAGYGAKRSFGEKKAGFGPRKTSYGTKPGSFADRGEREAFDATCGICGKPCRVPFKPNGSKPVLCTNCFKRDNNEHKEPGAFGNERKTRATYQARKPFDGAKPYEGKKPAFGTREAAPAGGLNLDIRMAAIEAKLDIIIKALND